MKAAGTILALWETCDIQLGCVRTPRTRQARNQHPPTLPSPEPLTSAPTLRRPPGSVGSRWGRSGRHRPAPVTPTRDKGPIWGSGHAAPWLGSARLGSARLSSCEPAASSRLSLRPLTVLPSRAPRQIRSFRAGCLLKAPLGSGEYVLFCPCTGYVTCSVCDRNHI